MEQTDSLFTSARREPAPLSADMAGFIFQQALAGSTAAPKPYTRNHHFGWEFAVAGALAILGFVTYRTLTQPVPGSALKNIEAAQGGDKPQPINENKPTVVVKRPPVESLHTPQIDRTHNAESPAPRHRHIKKPSVPQPSNTQMASVANVISTPVANRQIEGITVPLPEAPRGQMMVIVRRGEPDPALKPAPAVKVTVSRDPDIKTGYARAAAFHTDGNGSVVWTQCTVTGGGTASSSATETVTTGLNRPASLLKVERTDAGHLKPKEDQP